MGFLKKLLKKDPIGSKLMKKDPIGKKLLGGGGKSSGMGKVMASALSKQGKMTTGGPGQVSKSPMKTGGPGQMAGGGSGVARTLAAQGRGPKLGDRVPRGKFNNRK